MVMEKRVLEKSFYLYSWVALALQRKREKGALGYSSELE